SRWLTSGSETWGAGSFRLADCTNAALTLWNVQLWDAAGGNQRLGEPRGGGQAVDAAERQWAAVHRHPGLSDSRHNQRRRRRPVRVSDERCQPVRLYINQRGDTDQRRLVLQRNWQR